MAKIKQHHEAHSVLISQMLGANAAANFVTKQDAVRRIDTDGDGKPSDQEIAAFRDESDRLGAKKWLTDALVGVAAGTQGALQLPRRGKIGGTLEALCANPDPIAVSHETSFMPEVLRFSDSLRYDADPCGIWLLEPGRAMKWAIKKFRVGDRDGTAELVARTAIYFSTYARDVREPSKNRADARIWSEDLTLLAKRITDDEVLHESELHVMFTRWR